MPTVADYLDSITAYGRKLGAGGTVDLMGGGWGKTSAPFVYANAALAASELNREAEQRRFSAYAEGRGRGELNAERDMMDAMVSSGMDPATARAAIAERRATSLGTDLATARGQFAADRAMTDIDILGETASGIVSAEQYQDSLDQRRWMFEQELAERKKARKWGTFAGLVKTGASMALAPAGSFGMTALGSALGFGGGGGGGGSYAVQGGDLSDFGNGGMNTNLYEGSMFDPYRN